MNIERPGLTFFKIILPTTALPMIEMDLIETTLTMSSTVTKMGWKVMGQTFWKDMKIYMVMRMMAEMPTGMGMPMRVTVHIITSSPYYFTTRSLSSGNDNKMTGTHLTMPFTSLFPLFMLLSTAFVLLFLLQWQPYVTFESLMVLNELSFKWLHCK